MSTLHLALLSPPQLRYNQKLLALKAAKAVALLAYLAVTGKPQRREHLADLLWPKSRPDAARQNLSNRLWTIRKSFGEVVVALDTHHLELSNAVWSDVSVLEATMQSGLTTSVPLNAFHSAQLKDVLELWRGSFLDGLDVADAPDFELWLIHERDRLEQLYLAVIAELVRGYQGASNWPAVIETAQTGLRVDRLQEPLVRALMDAYARSGQRAEALRIYDHFHSALDVQLGVAPLLETDELRIAILKGTIQPEFDDSGNRCQQVVSSSASSSPHPLADAAFLSPPTFSRQSHSSHAPTVPFVGRKAEQTALTNGLERAAMGKAQIVLITGELGIGKSCLCQVWSDTLLRHLEPLDTHCLDTTQALPLAPLVTLLNRPDILDSLLHPDSSIPPAWLTELSRLLPEIQQKFPALPIPISVPPEEEQRRLFEALVQTLRSLTLERSKSPLILLIDDLHWADSSTLDWLVYLVDRFIDEPFLLVVAYRSHEASPRLTQVVVQWKRAGFAQEVPLTGLTIDETSQLIKALGGDVTKNAEMQEKSAGNPYFLTELASAEPGMIPHSLAELVSIRLQQLPTCAQQVLQMAAIQGRGIDLALLRQMNQLSVDEALDALDILLNAGIFTENDHEFPFRHPLIASILCDDLSAARRTYLHLQTAKALEAIHAENLHIVAGQLVMHYKEAGEPMLAAHYADLAACHAQSLGALTEAVSFYRLAHRTAPTAKRKVALGRCLLFDDQHLAQARQLFQEGLTGFEEEDDSSGIVDACLALGASYMLNLQGTQVLYWAERALTYVSKPVAPTIEADINRQLGAGSALLGLPTDIVETYYLKAIQVAREHELFEIAIDSLFGLGNSYLQRVEYQKAKASFEEAIDLAQANHIFFLEAITHNNLAYCLYLMGCLTTAKSNVEKGVQLSDTYKLLGLYQYLYSTRGEIALAEDAIDEAEAWFQKSMVEAEKYHNLTHIENVRANLGIIAQRQGDLDQALVFLKGAWEGIADGTDLFAQTKVGLQLADLYLERNEKVAANQVLAILEQTLHNQEWVGLKTWLDRLQAEL